MGHETEDTSTERRDYARMIPHRTSIGMLTQIRHRSSLKVGKSVGEAMVEDIAEYHHELRYGKQSPWTGTQVVKLQDIHATEVLQRVSQEEDQERRPRTRKTTTMKLVTRKHVKGSSIQTTTRPQSTGDRAMTCITVLHRLMIGCLSFIT